MLLFAAYLRRIISEMNSCMYPSSKFDGNVWKSMQYICLDLGENGGLRLNVDLTVCEIGDMKTYRFIICYSGSKFTFHLLLNISDINLQRTGTHWRYIDSILIGRGDPNME